MPTVAAPMWLVTCTNSRGGAPARMAFWTSTGAYETPTSARMYFESHQSARPATNGKKISSGAPYVKPPTWSEIDRRGSVVRSDCACKAVGIATPRTMRTRTRVQLIRFM